MKVLTTISYLVLWDCLLLGFGGRRGIRTRIIGMWQSALTNIKNDYYNVKERRKIKNLDYHLLYLKF